MAQHDCCVCPLPSTHWQLHQQLVRGHDPCCQHCKAGSGERHQDQVSAGHHSRRDGCSNACLSCPPRSQFVVTPGSEQIRATMERDGLVSRRSCNSDGHYGSGPAATTHSPPSLHGRTSHCLPWGALCWPMPVAPALGSGGGRMWRREKRTLLCPHTTATSLGGMTATPAHMPLWPPQRCALQLLCQALPPRPVLPPTADRDCTGSSRVP